jgi:hypothetical protein
MMSTKPAVENDELWVMLMSTVRHAFGRRSYLPGMVLDYCEKFFPRLSRHERGQIIEEIEKELLSAYDRTPPVLGDESTTRTWEEGLRKLKALEKGLAK